MQKLFETYDQCVGSSGIPDAGDLLPVAHATQQAHVEIVLDAGGRFRRVSLVTKEDSVTVLPATEKSAGRTSGLAPHPLCDKVQYCAGDYVAFGGAKESGFDRYRDQLERWCASEFRHPKAEAVLAYIKQQSLVRDAVAAQILVAHEGKLVVYEKSARSPKGEEADIGVPGIFKLLTPKKDGSRSIIDQGDAFIRWRVEKQGDPCTGTWEDDTLKQAWQSYEASQRSLVGFCMVHGTLGPLAEQHPARLRHGGDKAKLISSNDTSGFTFLGRFSDAEQAAGVSFDVTQKAHNALRWLVGRKQASRIGDQVFIAWAVGGQPIPDPWLDSDRLFSESPTPEVSAAETQGHDGDVGQQFARRLNKAIMGYRAQLSDSADIVVMGLDSATPGRLAITFYRELNGSELLGRVSDWHANSAWYQNFGKTSKFVGAPSPRDIAEAAYGRRLDDKLKKSTLERLLPCIVDALPIPRDVVEACVRRVSNRVGLDGWEWEKCLGIACAVFKGSHEERKYLMALEENRNTRDYLYGRLLAVAEQLESHALYVAGEKRETMAARLMQRFADRPASTWRTIELSLVPYKARLRARRPQALWRMEQLLDSLVGKFSTTDEAQLFTNDRPLSGEFLLGYHCQRQALRPTKVDSDSETVADDELLETPEQGAL